jgi:hypothetical protein
VQLAAMAVALVAEVDQIVVRLDFLQALAVVLVAIRAMVAMVSTMAPVAARLAWAVVLVAVVRTRELREVVAVLEFMAKALVVLPVRPQVAALTREVVVDQVVPVVVQVDVGEHTVAVVLLGAHLTHPTALAPAERFVLYGQALRAASQVQVLVHNLLKHKKNKKF